ncbi:MAG TPA: tRNA epoxyqueuosine(34) reductase QueG [Ktedonobacteraceae bacterium]|nr:tRNA epoxyqueuosine(34) reductase QueG [Ktedonobacteraceae bacterium]
MLNADRIKEQAYSLGFDLVRITTTQPFSDAEQTIKERINMGLFDGLSWFTPERAEVSCDPTALLPQAQSIISLAMFYLVRQPDPPASDLPHGLISRYAWGDDYHDLIKPKLQQFAEWLRQLAGQELGQEAETRLFVDTGRMVDRAVAQRSGLGWYGKNTNILTRGWGSWVFLAEIVTNLPIQADEPLKANCGNCEVCLHACPTGALPAPYVLDMTRCISYLTIELRGSIPIELRPLIGNLIYGCDICQQVCPVNKVAEKRLGLRPSIEPGGRHSHEQNSLIQIQRRPEFQPRPYTGSTPELIPLLDLTEEEFREKFKRSPIKRTKRRGFLRNVCVALGNSGDLRAVPALTKALSDVEPLIRGHAAWALGRLRGEEALAALKNALAGEINEEVKQEIQQALEMFAN